MRFFLTKKEQTRTNGRSNYDLVKGSQMMSPRLTTVDHSTTNMQQHKTSDRHHNSTSTTHRTAPHHTKHIILYSTAAGPIHSKWHEACTGIPGQMCLAWCERVRPTRNGPRPTHSGTHGKSGLCVQREPAGRAIIVIVLENRMREMKRVK